jgi:hypothetical protein
VRRAVAAALLGLWTTGAWAGTIDTAFLERPWPKQRERETEVGRHAVFWRERASRQEGIFAGLRFEAPLDRPQTWKLANEYQDIGELTPGVIAVRYLEQSETREVIQVDVKVLWKTLRLTFEVEKEPLRAVRFRLTNDAIGEYRGVSLFEELPGRAGAPPRTTVELATWLKPAHPIPPGLLLMVERMTMLQASKRFLEACERVGASERRPE